MKHLSIAAVPFGNPFIVWKNKVSSYTRQDEESDTEPRRSTGRSWIGKKLDGWSAEINICSVHKGRPSMVRFEKPKNNLSQENEAKTGRTIFHYWSTGTGYLQVVTSSDLANPWCLPCCITTTIQGEWDLWRELCEATSRVRGRQRGLWHGNNPKSQEKRTRISIFCQMVGISNHQCLMGTRTRVFKWQWHIDMLQTST